MTQQITVVQALVRALAQAGVQRIFGIPGGGSSLDLIDCAAAAGIDFVLTRTENAAVMMAGAVAETSGVPGVALVTKGPGVANGANGVAYASLDRAPVLLISDGFTPEQTSYITHQVFEQAAMLAPVVKGHSRLEGPDPTRDMADLIRLACRPPCGPVHVELTGARARHKIDDSACSPAAEASRADATPVDLVAVAAVQARIRLARRPVLLLGLEARLHAAQTRQLVATLGCPVLATYKAKGVVPDDDTQVLGLFTGGVHEAPCLAQADLLVLVGLDPVEMILQPWAYGKAAVEIGAALHPVHYIQPEARAIGPLGELLSAVEAGLPAGNTTWTTDEMHRLRQDMRERLACRPVEHGVAPDRVALLAAQACERRGVDARLSVDAGAHMFSATSFFPSRRPGDILISNGLATMAFALPAAIAAGLDDPSRPVLCFTGDGGLLMGLGELTTAVATAVPVIVIVFNDGALSQIDIKQQSRGLPPVGVRWARADFAQVMSALGGIGLVAHDEAQYTAALEAALSHAADRRPCLIDVQVDAAGYAEQLKAMRG